jgi:hypothetical protein
LTDVSEVLTVSIITAMIALMMATIRPEIFTAMLMFMIFWVVAPCSIMAHEPRR